MKDKEEKKNADDSMDFDEGPSTAAPKKPGQTAGGDDGLVNQPGMVLDSMPDSDISADQISINLSDGPESHRNTDASPGPETIGANEENK